MSIYDFTLKALVGGGDIALSAFKGKVLLIVNVASKCGFTKQYAGLEALHKNHAASGLQILGVPCNQFGAQEPGSPEEIVTFCSRTYDVTFPLTSKLDVNGPNEAPLYTFLKAGKEDIQWNFEKFLVNKEGAVVGRFGSRVTPEELESKIAALL
ncbi:hypothetical protein HDU97_006345 [Phlyctochytrium planicorne]|nr:hypothetical protein HDU97_006345 [Phlyctochytrium planicorne]